MIRYVETGFPADRSKTMCGRCARPALISCCTIET